MPVQTRSQKKKAMVNNPKQNNHEVDAALVLIKVKKENEDMWNSLKMEEELQKKKEELVKLKKAKRYTDRHNNLKEIISIYTQRADRLEMKITALLSSIDN